MSVYDIARDAALYYLQLNIPQKAPTPLNRMPMTLNILKYNTPPSCTVSDLHIGI